MNNRREFWQDLEELLRKHKAAIVCDNTAGTFGSIGFQFGLESVYTSRCHVTGSDILDLAYELESDNI